MSAVVVDSNVLLDVLAEDSVWFSWSSAMLYDLAQHSLLHVNEIIYAEISVNFSDMLILDRALEGASIRRESIPYEAAFLVGKCFSLYRRRGGTKRSPLPDFFIGAHAAVRGYRLLTRDAARYRTYFPRLDLIAPD